MGPAVPMLGAWYLEGRFLGFAYSRARARAQAIASRTGRTVLLARAIRLLGQTEVVPCHIVRP